MVTAAVWHVISEPDLLDALTRCEQGGSAALVYAEIYVNGTRERVEGELDASG